VNPFAHIASIIKYNKRMRPLYFIRCEGSVVCLQKWKIGAHWSFGSFCFSFGIWFPLPLSREEERSCYELYTQSSKSQRRRNIRTSSQI